MPDLKDPQKQIPVSPGFFLAEGADPVPAGLTAEQKHDAGGVLHHRAGQPLVRQGVRQSHLGGADRRGVLQPDRRHGAGPRGAIPPRSSRRWPRNGSRGATTSGGSSARSSTPRPTSARSRATNTASGRTPFAANCPSRLRSDQILEALAQALDVSFDGPANPRRANRVVKVSKAKRGRGQGRQAGRQQGLPASEPPRPVQHHLRLRPVPAQR